MTEDDDRQRRHTCSQVNNFSTFTKCIHQVSYFSLLVHHGKEEYLTKTHKTGGERLKSQKTNKQRSPLVILSTELIIVAFDFDFLLIWHFFHVFL